MKFNFLTLLPLAGALMCSLPGQADASRPTAAGHLLLPASNAAPASNSLVAIPSVVPSQSLIGINHRMADASNVPDIYGTIISSKAAADGTAANAVGMYKLSNGVFTRLNTQAKSQYGGAPMNNGYYYAVNVTGGKVYVDAFLTTTWKRSTHTSTTVTGIKASDVAYDPTSDMVFGCFYNDAGNGYVWGKADYTTRKRTEIKPLEMSLNSVMIDAAGQAYAIDMTGMLLRVDKNTGNMTNIGHTGVTPLYMSSATIDAATGRCFWTVNPVDSKGYLYEVNLTTGEASLLYQFANSDELTGIYVPEATPQAGVPAAVADMKTNFTAGSLSGNITATAPAKDYAGNALEGNLQYTLWVDGINYGQASVAPAQAITIPVVLTEAGMHSFVLSFSNAVGESPRKSVKAFLGNDTPGAPAPSLTYENGAFTITWDKVTKTVNGGYMDADRLTYTVVRLPDNVTVADNLSALSFTDTVAPTPGRMIAYKYQVKATFEGNTGAAGTTAVYPLGEITTPYFEGFDSAESMNNFIILDSNADGIKWAFSNGMQSAYITNSSKPHDDWLITAAIRMKKGVNYKLVFEAMASFNPEKIEVMMGRAATPAAMTDTLVPPTTLEADFTLKPTLPEFTVPEDGLYYIGWHAISDASSFYLYVDNIALTDDDIHSGDALEPPYLQQFSESAVLSDFSIIDSNVDGFLWNISQGEARVAAGAGKGLDDWMITPGFNLKAGHSYEISLKARTSNEGARENFEIKAGNVNAIDSLNTTVIPNTAITQITPTTSANYFTPDHDGVYYFGIHACTPAGAGYELYIDDFKVASPLTPTSPAAVENLTITPAPYGELKATIAFNAPKLDFKGNPITELKNIDIAYADSIVATVQAPQPGAAYSCEVNVEKFGTHTFVVTPYTSTQAGVPASVSGYIGINIPAAPSNAKMVEEGNTGKVTLSWSAPTVDIEGKPLRPSDVKYIIAEIINGQQLVMARDISDTTYSLQAVAPGADQQYKSYAIFALTAAGSGSGIAANSGPVGAPYTLPYKESFENGQLKTLIMNQITQPQAEWNMYNDNYFSDAKSADNDNGFVALSGNNLNAAGTLFTGKIDLGDADDPIFSFYLYNQTNSEYNDNNEILVQLMTSEGQVAQLGSFTIYDKLGTTHGWGNVELPLKDFKGKTVRFAIGARIKGFTLIGIDGLKVQQKNGSGISSTQIAVTPKAYGLTDEIAITGADALPVTIFDTYGRTRYFSKGSHAMSVSLPTGLYIVKIGATVIKVSVK